MLETPPSSGLLGIIEGFTGYRDHDVPAKLMRWLLDGLKSSRYARLEQAGHQDTKLALARVFVDIEAEGRQGQPAGGWRHIDRDGEDAAPLVPGIVSEMLQARPLRPMPLRPMPETIMRERLVEGEPARGGYVLIGGPGQGKSTVTQYLCQIHRASVLAVLADRLEPEHAVIVEEIQEQARADSLSELAQPCIPAQVSLPELAAWMVNHSVEPARAVVGFLCEQIGKAQPGGRQDIPDSDLHALVGLVPWLVVFDGLDEVPASGGRERAVTAIDAFLSRLREQDAKVLLVATTRPQGYGDELSTMFAPRYLQPLSQARALHYGRRLVEFRYRGERERQEKVLERLKQACSEEATARLMTTPLQVTIMAALVDRIGRPPHQRWRLFRDYYQVIYEREIERPHSPAAELLRTYRSQIEDIHHHAGLLLQVESERGGGTEAMLTGAQFERLIEERLDQEEFSVTRGKELAQQILQVAAERLVFLVSPRDDRYGFELRSLQEFMAAEALMNGKDADVERRMAVIARPSFWRNVFLFAAGKCFADRRHQRDAVVALCERLNAESEDSVAAETLAGSYLALAILKDGSVDAPKHASQLARIATRLVELPPDNYVQTWLAEFGEPVRATVEEKLTSGWPDELPIQQSLGRWVTLAALLEEDCSWAYEVAEKRWPKDAPARQAIARAMCGYSEGRHRWLAQRIADNVAHFPPELVEELEESAAHPRRDESFTGLLTENRYVRIVVSHVTFGFQSIIHGRDGRNHVLFSAEDRTPAWQPRLSARRLLEQPSKEVLANELEKLAQSFDPESFRWWARKVPWPLGVCLALARTPDELISLATEIRLGRLGDVKEWQATERSWTGRNISIDELIATLEQWPFYGHLLLSDPHSVGFYTGGDVVAFWRSYVERYRYEERLDTRALLACLLIYAFAPLDIHAELTHLLATSLTCNLVASLIKDGGDPYYARKIVMYMIDHGSPEDAEQWRSLAESVKKGDADEASAIDTELARWKNGVATPAEVESWLSKMAGTPGEGVSLSGRIHLLNEIMEAFSDSASLLRYTRILRAGAAVDESDLLSFIHGRLLESFLGQASPLSRTATWYELSLPSPAPEEILGSPKAAPAATSTEPREQNSTSPRIEHIRIRGVRVLDALDIAVTPPPPPSSNQGRWLVLLGENGVGKSTVLRSLVLALAEPDVAQSLPVAGNAPLLPNGASEAEIAVTVSGMTFSARILRTGARERLADSDRTGPPRPLLFAYGCGRGTAIGGADREVSYAALDSVATLFDESARLISAETWLKLLRLNALTQNSTHATIYDTVVTTLRGLLPGVEHIDADGDGVWFSGAAVGERVPMTGLSDGYITTIGWVSDLLARWVHRAGKLGHSIQPGFNRTMTGLVLVDEIDLHLHPRWQREVIGMVRQVFPCMSFVVTTHNPLTLLGAQPGEVVILRRDGGPVRAIPLDLPKGISSDQILTGEWFGLASTMDPDTVRLLDEHRRLLRDGIPPSDPERQRVGSELKRRLDGFPGATIEQLARQVAAEVLDETYPAKSAEEKVQLRAKLKSMVKERLDKRQGA